MKNKNPIGFIRQTKDYNDQEREPKKTQPDQNQLIENFIDSIYTQEPQKYSSLEHISPIDLFELLSQNFEVNKEQIYTIMSSKGFKCIQLNGSIYWEVYTTEKISLYK